MKSRIKRFYYVHSARGRIAHIADHITEGYLTRCGKMMFLGWKWNRQRKLPVCAACEEATSAAVRRETVGRSCEPGVTIHVQRVRAPRGAGHLPAA